MPQIEHIGIDERIFAYVVRGGDHPDTTTFVTPNEANLQVGFVVKAAGDLVPRHDHHPVERNIIGTAEVLIVREGSGSVQFFDPDRNPVGETKFSKGDVLVLLEGGHGFTFDEHTVLLEVKQGPYPGVDEKERF